MSETKKFITVDQLQDFAEGMCEANDDRFEKKGGGGSGGGHIISDGTTEFTQRETLEFGDGFSISDNSQDNSTDVSFNGEIDWSQFSTPTPLPSRDGMAYIPCGKIEAFMTTTAPQGYLKCDGTEYLKTQYPQLAAVLAATDTAQGTTVFAGSDANHFKVPDLRGEFLRGTGTNSHTNQGSGANVGIHQDGTDFINMTVSNSAKNIYYGTTGDTDTQNYDTKHTSSKTGCTPNGTYFSDRAKDKYFTSRPTNTSVLFCIASQDIFLAPRHVYSTDEHVVGTWIDGKPIYEKTISDSFTLTSVSGYTQANVDITSEISNIGTVISHIIFVEDLQLPYVHGMAALNMGCNVTSSELQFRCGTSQTGTKSYIATIQYTKTTDTYRK